MATHPARTSKRITWIVFAASRRIATSEGRDNGRGQLFPLLLSFRIAIEVIQEHIHVLDTILQQPLTPFNFIEKQLLLKTPRDLEGSATVSGRNTMIYQQLALDLILDGRLKVQCYIVSCRTKTSERLTTISLPVNA